MSLNLASVVFETSKHYPDQISLGKDMTYKQLAKKVMSYSQSIVAQRIGPGDRVALMMENCPEFTTTYFAILNVGAIVVPISILLSPRELAYCVNHSGAKAIVYTPQVSGKVTQAQELFTSFVAAMPIEELGFLSPDCFDPFPTDPNDTAVIFYTSGTTGQPKGAEVTHFNLYSNACWVAERSLERPGQQMELWGKNHRTLAALALSHSFGQTCMQNAPLINGGQVSYLSRFGAQDLVDKINVDGVTILAAVPRMVKELVDLRKNQKFALPSLQYCLVGGAPINQDLVQVFEAQFGVEVLEGYGLSETSPVIAFRTPVCPRKQGSVGRAIRGVDLGVVKDDGEQCLGGEVGEIVVRGHAVMKGYYNNPLATQETIKKGWLHTGDMGFIDEEGDVFLIDRKKDVIIRNGYNIYPVEVEQVIHEVAGVQEVAVVGIEHERVGQEIKAFVVGHVAIEDLDRHCRSNLASFKYPRIFELVDALPKGHKGQVLKRELRLFV